MWLILIIISFSFGHSVQDFRARKGKVVKDLGNILVTIAIFMCLFVLLSWVCESLGVNTSLYSRWQIKSCQKNQTDNDWWTILTLTKQCWNLIFWKHYTIV